MTQTPEPKKDRETRNSYADLPQLPTFNLHKEPILNKDPDTVGYKSLNFPRTARIIADGGADRSDRA